MAQRNQLKGLIMSKKKKAKARYAFPSAGQCPRCGSFDTEAYSTQGKIQYRRCRAAICRWRYSVRGVKIKTNKKKETKDDKQKTKNETTAGTG